MDRPEQSAIIRADGAVDIVRQEIIHGVPVHPGREAEDLVGYRTDLDADAALLHLFHDVRVPWQGEAVADAFRSEQERVHQVAIGVHANIQRLAAVKEEGNVNIRLPAVLLEVKELRDEVLQRSSLALLADEVVACRSISPFSQLMG